jgi:DNA-binding beta-propeller fold protein YncE
MNRRTFLQRAVAATAAPFVLTSARSEPTNPILGVGQQRYECIHDWGKLPANLRWQTTHGVCIDSAGLIYIVHQGTGRNVVDTVVVFDSTGKFVRSFGREFYPGGHGIDVRKEGKDEFLYLCDIHNRQVAKTSLTGQIIWQIGFPREAMLGGQTLYQRQEQFRPSNVAFAPDGGFYVTDGHGAQYIHQYDKNAKYVRSWGGPGDDAGKFKLPHGIWWDDRTDRTPRVVVADQGNARLSYFTADGKPVETVPQTRETGSLLQHPSNFDIRKDVLLVADLQARVSLFNVRNEPIIHLGDDPEWSARVANPDENLRAQPKKWLPGRFVHPHDACFDKDGNIFVVEWVEPGRVTMLKKIG